MPARFRPRPLLVLLSLLPCLYVASLSFTHSPWFTFTRPSTCPISPLSLLFPPPHPLLLPALDVMQDKKGASGWKDKFTRLKSEYAFRPSLRLLQDIEGVYKGSMCTC